jgi:hypothetical protein
MGFTVNIKLTGVPDARRRLANITSEGSKAMARALYVEGETIMADSKGKYVPVKSGNLRSSGHVQKPKQHKKYGWVIDLGYGGPAVPYAVVQHERMDYYHRHGESKYLEKPALKRAPKIGRNVSKAVLAVMQKNGKRGK